MKNRIVYAVAWVCYWLGIVHLFYFLNRRCKRVLTFHNVLPDELMRDDDGGGMSLSVSEFRNILREIGRFYTFSTNFDDTGSVTLTFDDGFLNQYEIVPEVLGEIPAVLFVAGSNLDREELKDAPAVDLLTVWLAHTPTVRGNRMAYWVHVLRPQYAKDVEAYGRNVVRSCDGQYPFEDLFRALPTDYLRLRLGGISSAQLENLRVRGWKIGWHSFHHYVLSAIPEEAKKMEFEAPEIFRGSPMSYPYGERVSVSVADQKWAKRAGFPLAFSNLPDADPENRFFLPRFSVPSEKILLHFHLSGLRYFLKNGRLLPRA